MDILKIVFQVSDDGSLMLGDAIRHKGKLWLVPEWRAGPEAGTERPARIISLDGLSLEKPGPQYQADYFLPIPLSKSTLAGGRAQVLDVIEAPDIIRNVNTLQ
jgi:hypothetical protein